MYHRLGHENAPSLAARIPLRLRSVVIPAGGSPECRVQRSGQVRFQNPGAWLPRAILRPAIMAHPVAAVARPLPKRLPPTQSGGVARADGFCGVLAARKPPPSPFAIAFPGGGAIGANVWPPVRACHQPLALPSELWLLPLLRPPAVLLILISSTVVTVCHPRTGGRIMGVGIPLLTRFPWQ